MNNLHVVVFHDRSNYLDIKFCAQDYDNAKQYLDNSYYTMMGDPDYQIVEYDQRYLIRYIYRRRHHATLEIKIANFSSLPFI